MLLGKFKSRLLPSLFVLAFISVLVINIRSASEWNPNWISEESRAKVQTELDGICHHLKNSTSVGCPKPTWTGKSRWIAGIKFDVNVDAQQLSQILVSRGWRNVSFDSSKQATFFCQGSLSANFSTSGSLVVDLTVAIAGKQNCVEKN